MSSRDNELLMPSDRILARLCLGSSGTSVLPPVPPLRHEHPTLMQRRAAGAPAGGEGAHSKREAMLGWLFRLAD